MLVLALLHLFEELDDAALDDHIQRRGRLVGEDERGPEDGGEGDGDTLAHAAGKLVREGAENGGRQPQVGQVLLRHAV